MSSSEWGKYYRTTPLIQWTTGKNDNEGGGERGWGVWVERT